MNIKNIIYFFCLIMLLLSCEYRTSSDATPEYFSEEEQVTSPCGECNGTGLVYTYYGYARCYVCGGNGVNISFKSRQAYYAECSHCSGCELFVREHTGSTTCKCGCLMSAHYKRYR